MGPFSKDLGDGICSTQSPEEREHHCHKRYLAFDYLYSRLTVPFSWISAMKHVWFFCLKDTWPAFSRNLSSLKLLFLLWERLALGSISRNSNFCSHITMWEKPVLIKSKSYRHSTLYIVPYNWSTIWWTVFLLLVPIISHLKEIQQSKKISLVFYGLVPYTSTMY